MIAFVSTVYVCVYTCEQACTYLNHWHTWRCSWYGHAILHGWTKSNMYSNGYRYLRVIIYDTQGCLLPTCSSPMYSRGTEDGCRPLLLSTAKCALRALVKGAELAAAATRASVARLPVAVLSARAQAAAHAARQVCCRVTQQRGGTAKSKQHDASV